MTKRVIAALCVLALALSIAPMLVVSVYSHPFYDDFGFTLAPRAVWRETGSVWETLGAGLAAAHSERYTWQGAYTTNYLTDISPFIRSEGQYFWTTLALLAALRGGVFALAFAACRTLLGAGRAEATAVGAMAAFLMTQFAPEPSEAFFWANGGYNYALITALTLLSLARAIHLLKAESARDGVGWCAALLLPLTLSGGGSYAPGLFAVCAFGLLTLWALLTRQKRRWPLCAATLWLLACFLYNCLAPGNAVRAGTLTGGMSPVKAVAQAFYFGFALMGRFFSLPLLAALLVTALLLLPALRRTQLRFSHPLLWTAALACLFCAQLAPTLYTGNYLGDGRAVDTYWFTYVALSFTLCVYWLGWAAKRLPEKAEAERVRPLPLLVAATLLAVGCVGYRPENAESYGPQNMTGGSALRSLLSGEAAEYDRQMDAREAALNDPAQPEVELRPITGIPKVFMSDALESGMRSYVLELYRDYYGKTAVTAKE